MTYFYIVLDCIICAEYQEHFLRFDNFQFVDFHAVQRDSKNPEAAVSLAALMEVLHLDITFLFLIFYDFI